MFEPSKRELVVILAKFGYASFILGLV